MESGLAGRSGHSGVFGTRCRGCSSAWRTLEAEQKRVFASRLRTKRPVRLPGGPSWRDQMAIVSDAEAPAECGPEMVTTPVRRGGPLVLLAIEERTLPLFRPLCGEFRRRLPNHRMPLDEDAATQSLIGDGCIVSTPLPTAARRGPRRSTLGASSVHTGNLFREGASGRGATASVPG